MNTLMTLDPWSFLDDLLDTSSKTFKNMKAHAAGRFPPVNVFLGDNAVLIDLELPGKTAQDVDLTLEPQALVIAGKTADKQASPAWSRRLELPFRVNPDRANAKFENGILRVALPKAEAADVRKITIQ